MLDALKEYVEYLEDHYYALRHRSENKHFVNITDVPYKLHKDDTKLIAWYLPQFHRIAINDKYRGKGFTEWTNCTRNMPLFTGHNQPWLPYDMGFYDLMNVETFKRQIELAKMYGIYGFAFHYYWFSGVKLMEKPIELFLKHKELDIKFCMHWCSEEWRTLWDGENKDLIIDLKLTQNDDEKFMHDLLPYMKDDRYIKIDGKPILQVYRVNFCEQKRFAELMKNFRRYAKIAGFPDLYIMLTTKSGVTGNLGDWGIDALVEFPDLSVMQEENRYLLKGYVNRHFSGKSNIFDVQKFIDKIEQSEYLKQFENENIYRSVMVNFDNTPRRITSDKSFCVVNSTPSNYKKWLKNVMQVTRKRRWEENYAFIFAWNEWAECASLEPNMFYGYAYLQATKEVLEETRNIFRGQVC
jgi:lipopolysaccharide biosynthesis protein